MSKQSNLEELIRAAAAAGELTHLSIVPVAGKGPQGIGWSASFSPGSAWGTGFAVAADPVDAIIGAMTDERLRKTVRKIEKVLAEAPPEAVVAAVKKTRKRKGSTASVYVDDSDFA